jgi:23S rRNA (guanosine2251-2'-O)-methyltransferase
VSGTEADGEAAAQGHEEAAGSPKAPTRRSPTPGAPPRGRGRRRSGHAAREAGRGWPGPGRRASGRASAATRSRAASRARAPPRAPAPRCVSCGCSPSRTRPSSDRHPRAGRGRAGAGARGRAAKFFAEARCEAPQGVLAKARPSRDAPRRDSPLGARSRPFLVAVDGVTDPGNLGALLRSAECAGARDRAASPPSGARARPTVTKAAAGCRRAPPVRRRRRPARGAAAAVEPGVWVVGLDGEAPPGCGTSGRRRSDRPGPRRRGRGLSRLVRQRCDELVQIPLNGALGSLNVSVAGALAASRSPAPAPRTSRSPAPRARSD